MNIILYKWVHDNNTKNAFVLYVEMLIICDIRSMLIFDVNTMHHDIL